MAGYRSVNYYELCRLCTSSTGPRIDIFSNDGRKKNLIQKIGECLPVAINEDDRLPKSICGQCVQQIEAICQYRNSCLNSQTMLEGCLSSSSIQNGGRVYIKDSNGKVIPGYTQAVSTSSMVTVPNNIIQTVGLQSSTSFQQSNNIIDVKPQVFPVYSGNSEQINVKFEDLTSSLEATDKQAKHNALAEFLKMKPNIKVTPLKKKDPPRPAPVQKPPAPTSTTMTLSIPASPAMSNTIQMPMPMQQSMQQSIQQMQNKINIQDIKIMSPNKCLLPITLKTDNDSDQQQIVAHIDAKNLMLPTTYHVQMKLEPKFSTIDGQQIMHLTPTSMPATIQIAPQSLQQTFQATPSGFQFVSGGSIDAATSTNEAEMVFNSLGQLENHSITLNACEPQPPPLHPQPQSQPQQPTFKIEVPSMTSMLSEESTPSYTVQRINNQIKQIKQKQGLTISRVVPQQAQQQQQQQQQIQLPVKLEAATSTTAAASAKQMKVSKVVTKTNMTPPKARANVAANNSTLVNSESLFECNICNKEFKKKEHLAQHVKLHAGLRPFQCGEEGCNKAFSRKEHLMRHIVSHTGKKMFNCEMCHKFFSRKDNLNKHKRTHTDGGNTNGQFVCDVCNKSFVVKMYYIQHKLMHVKNEQAKDSAAQQAQ